jgi:drug/metabolite transporter (DMT)-like permease
MTLGGWLVFGQVPDQAVLLGASVVVSSGLYLLWREFSASPAVAAASSAAPPPG